MSRVKRGTIANKRRKNLRKATKGYKWGRNSKLGKMKEALYKARVYMFAHRRKKKGDFRTLWNIQVNAAARANGTTYSKLIGGLAKSNIAINRKMLANLGQEHPEIFSQIAEKASK
ncbi:50S ribosomal protein L20 [Candidatus Azambacteria bacterium]|nr:50S ribosomal protein L20 [Candidatus Azambacteria bacterium]